jgi:RNA polymerase sigma factor (sigma-70 family)
MATSRTQPGWRSLESLFDTGALGGLTDGELLECFQTSRDAVSHDAFRILVERHGPMVLGRCRSLLRDPHEADDAFQATFLVLVRKAGSIKRRDTIGPWLHGVAGRVATRARDRSVRRQRREVEVTAEVPCPVRPVTESPSVEAVVQDEIARLPESFRAPVVLCCLEGLSYELAACRLGVTEPTLRGRLHRARKQLALRLRGRGIIAGTFTSAVDPVRLTLPPLPSSLVESTVQFSVRWSSVTGLFSGAAVVPESIAGLAQGVIKAVLLQSLKLSGICGLIAAGVLGTVVVAQQGNGASKEGNAASKNSAATTKQTDSGPKTAEQPARRPRPTAEQLIGTLNVPIDAEFPTGTTLEQLLKHVKKQTTTATFPGIPIYVSPVGLQEAKVDMATKVFINVKQRPVHEVIDAAFQGLNLTHTVADGFLLIDSFSGCRIARLELRVQEIDQKLDQVLEAIARLEKRK